MASQRDPRVEPALLCVGWRERVALPDLSRGLVDAKIDTGASFSTLHAHDLTMVEIDDQTWARFTMLPDRRSQSGATAVSLLVRDWRRIRSSSGDVQERPVVHTRLQLGSARIPVELTLTDRASMRYRMLIGRRALSGRALVDSSRSYLLGSAAAAEGVHP